jgi:ABC-type lipoprotein export system ATPase subunit
LSLLELRQVTKRYRKGQREVVAVNAATIVLEHGELAFVWGSRRSGRTTLLRIAAGLEAPDSGSVLFEGEEAERAIGTGVGYVAKTLRPGEEQGVLEQVAAVLLARGVGVHEARERSRRALARVDATRCAAMKVSELSGAEALRVALARTLVLEPKAIVIDEPAATVEIAERDEVLGLLRALAREGVAVLASTGEAEQLAGADLALRLRDGELQGRSAPSGSGAQVVPLRRGA